MRTLLATSRTALVEAWTNRRSFWVQVLAMLLKVEDGVPHQLSGSVIRDVAAAFDLEQLDAALREHFGIH